MSGAEVIGLVSGIISIIDASLKVCGAIGDASGLPQSFRDINARLPLVHDTLETISKGITDENDASLATSRTALTKALESCRDKANALKNVLEAVKPSAGASRMTRYLKAIKAIRNGDKAENLMNGILSDLHVFTSNHAVQTATQSQVNHLLNEIKGGKNPDNSMEGEAGSSSRPAVSMHNAATGPQYVHSGRGDQNVVSGRGIQINGQPAGAFYFDRVPR
ncbi:uncharacterized protein F4822DRAFT_418544 [Hypoxylon trugodes]|uniref:uncharacterized protein n=1 Tax=Hypoxylon trugodes TaxID=326681 RepID=UPI0021A1F572|nr:uncharacterized protein F4822DRAFT_418544 [Hypoxylon trugodes]KAI1384072.1 hypothetical protein F4822DRAFT_418544 [Hypoxylon trugodes]